MKSIDSEHQRGQKMLSATATLSFCFLFYSFILSSTARQTSPIPGTCRNDPGSPNFPSSRDFAILNNTVSGRLVTVVPFVKFCTTIGGCTLQQFTSSTFRGGVPGAMNQVRTSLFYYLIPINIFVSIQVNWEQVSRRSTSTAKH